MPDVTCKNCSHLLMNVYGDHFEHLTRHYHPSGYPYTTIYCYAPGCECTNPIPKKEVS